MKKLSIFIIFATVIAGCTPTLQSMSHSDAIKFCQDQAAEAAQTTTGNVRFGINSQTGPSFGAGIGINLTPRPYAATYEECMAKLAANGQIHEGI